MALDFSDPAINKFAPEFECNKVFLRKEAVKAGSNAVATTKKALINKAF